MLQPCFAQHKHVIENVQIIKVEIRGNLYIQVSFFFECSARLTKSRCIDLLNEFQPALFQSTRMLRDFNIILAHYSFTHNFLYYRYRDLFL